MFSKFFKDESGATAIEYGILAAFISVVIIGVVTTLGEQLQVVFQSVIDALDPPPPPPK
ncbi:Flp family type IVb pilin [Pseudovibrio sp. Ad37]|uniref:Flp family type IVb pilin n=1 Tax=Pseudovibrio sp. Ad37 TaxID=989422 RepID=UPI0007B2833F|nr:Flp family type IVb pilin [Pseudovibrio sp. Ad37]KZL24823.1 Flp/Fap pilin component [Pseudovibrio sp. Ad37]